MVWGVWLFEMGVAGVRRKRSSQREREREEGRRVSGDFFWLCGCLSLTC